MIYLTCIHKYLTLHSDKTDPKDHELISFDVNFFSL